MKNQYPQPPAEPSKGPLISHAAAQVSAKDDEEVKGESLDNAKFKNQFEAKNDYNGKVAPLANHYPQPPPEPTKGPLISHNSIAQKDKAFETHT